MFKYSNDDDDVAKSGHRRYKCANKLVNIVIWKNRMRIKWQSNHILHTLTKKSNSDHDGTAHTSKKKKPHIQQNQKIFIHIR